MLGGIFKCPLRRSLHRVEGKGWSTIPLETFLPKGMMFFLVPCIHCIFEEEEQGMPTVGGGNKTFP